MLKNKSGPEKVLGKIFITGADGFIGRAVWESLCHEYKIIALDKITSNEEKNEEKDDGVIFIKGNITDVCLLEKICTTYVPDVVIHCAGVAHQKINSPIDKRLYDEVNHLATSNLAKVAFNANPKVHFIFLSSISVYGESHNQKQVKEEDLCWPTTEYARSKLDAENGLKAFFNEGHIKTLDILRLAPVYDSRWSLNLEKRVFGFKKLFYMKFGTGNQKMSVLARQNLVDFVLYRIEKNSIQCSCNVFNVTDKKPCSFNEIIKIFKKSEYQPDKRVIKVPLLFVWITTRIAGFLIKDKANLIHSFYDKLSKDLVFDNSKMLNEGFDPKFTFTSVFEKLL